MKAGLFTPCYIERNQLWLRGFIAGPLKTADIGQSLATGTHGAPSLTIFILAETA